MAKKNVMNVTNEVYERLEPLVPDERTRVISAVLALLGQEQITPPPDRVTQSNAQQYFDQKEPRTKIELLAVAASFREQHQQQHKHTRADLKTVIHDEGRRNFDAHNFSTDIRNAKNKSLFTKGKDIQLSYYGQQYVDALPDREKVKNLRAPAKRRRKKAKKNKAKTKRT